MKVTLKTNIIVDIVMFLAMALTSISGIVIKVIAPLRRFAQEEWVREAAQFIVGNRRLWGKIHLWAGVILLVVLVVHIVLHWTAVDSFFKKHIPSRGWRIALYAILLVISLVSLIPWIWAF